MSVVLLDPRETARTELHADMLAPYRKREALRIAKSV